MKQKLKDPFYFESSRATEKAQEMLKEFKLSLVESTAFVNGILFSGLLAFSLRTSGESYFRLENISLLVLCASLFIVWNYVRKSKNETVGGWALNVILLVSIPFGIALTGGIYSIGLIYYLTHIALIYAMEKAVYGHAVAVWAGVSIVFFSFYGGSPVMELSFWSIFFNTASLFAATVPIFYVFNERDQMAELLKVVERKQAASVIMRRLAHEVGNSLQVPLIIAGEIKNGGDIKDDLETIDQSLERIEELFKSLRGSMEDRRIVDFLMEHDSAIKILEELNPKSGL